MGVVSGHCYQAEPWQGASLVPDCHKFEFPSSLYNILEGKENSSLQGTDPKPILTVNSLPANLN